MKIRILDRILVALAGLIVLVICAGVVAQVFFSVDIAGYIGKALTTDTVFGKVIIAAACFLLLLIGVYCFLLLFRHRRRKDRFIMQKMESGELAISLKAMESMVARCLDQRKEIQTQSIRLENQRDGLIIRIRGTVASGISIPLTVDTLQKQIKQYVTACTGVEVKGIRVQIESSGEEAKDAPFMIEGPTPTPLLQSAEKAETKETVPVSESDDADDTPTKADEIPAAPISWSSAESAIEAVENLKKEYEEDMEDDRPIHQRLFSTPEEPCIMPLPPENLNSEITELPSEPANDPDTAEKPDEKDLQDIEKLPDNKSYEPEEIPDKSEIPADKFNKNDTEENKQ